MESLRRTRWGCRPSRKGKTTKKQLYSSLYLGWLSSQTSFLLFSRLSCYKCITDTMQELVNQSKAAPQSPSVPKQPGPPVMTSDPNMLSNEEATAHVSLKKKREGGSAAHFPSSLCKWSAFLMRTCHCPVVWAGARLGPEVPGRAVSHRPVQLVDPGWPDGQAAGGNATMFLHH